MRQVIPGVWHWSAFHEPIGAEVSSYLLEQSRVVVDPKLPPGGFGELPVQPAAVVLTTGLHDRDAARFAEMFEIPVLTSQAGVARLGGSIGSVGVQAVGDGEELAPGVRLVPIGSLCDDEYALVTLLDSGAGAVAFADGVVSRHGALGFVPDGLMGDDPGAVKQGLRSALARVCDDYEFDTLLFAHGEPIATEGRAALRAFVASA